MSARLRFLAEIMSLLCDVAGTFSFNQQRVWLLMYVMAAHFESATHCSCRHAYADAGSTSVVRLSKIEAVNQGRHSWWGRDIGERQRSDFDT